MKVAGSAVHFFARWRVVTVPVVVLLAIAGIYGYTQVDEEVDRADFTSSDTDFINSLDVLVRAVRESPDAVAAVQVSEGVQLTAGPDGLPTDAAQVEAIYRYTSTGGVPGPDGAQLWSPEDVQAAVFVGDDFQATRVEFTLNTVSDLEISRASRTAVEDAQANFEATTPIEFVWVDSSGEAITGEDSLTTFTATMLTSLVVAFVLCALIAWAFMRSFKYAVVSVVPILLVVGWIYLFMYIFDYSINPVTATIAAIAVGVGVDFAMHFTMRFWEEFEGEPSRFPALHRAGEGTGGALVLSALTSVGGFLVMALAPMLIFADFGLLTAVMIFFSLVVALLVLPSLLLLVTPSRQGAERERLLDAFRTDEYDPHSRETAVAAHRG